MPRRLLVVTRHTPLPWEDGAGAYLFDILRFLRSRGWRIDVLWTQPHDHLRWQGVWALPASFCEVARLHVPGGWRVGRRQAFPAIYWLPFKARMAHRLKTWLRITGRQRPPRPASAPRSATAHNLPERAWMAAANAAESAWVGQWFRRLKPQAAISNYAWMAPAVPSTFGGRHLCVHPDVAWKRAELLAATTGHPPALTAADEARLLGHADAVAAISAADAAELRPLLPDRPVLVAPKAVTPDPLPPGDDDRLLFVGSGNQFNAEGLAWFLREVWPLVRAERPAARLDVCGTVDRAVPDRPEGVTFHGPVDDLRSFYATASVVVVPLLRATGLNIKLVDAAARRRAIVTTPVVLAGAPFLASAVKAALTPSEFAAAVAGFFAEPRIRNEWAQSALIAVSQALDPQSSYALLERWLTSPGAIPLTASAPAHA